MSQLHVLAFKVNEGRFNFRKTEAISIFCMISIPDTFSSIEYSSSVYIADSKQERKSMRFFIIVIVFSSYNVMNIY